MYFDECLDIFLHFQSLQGGNPGSYPGRQAAGMFSSMLESLNVSSFSAADRIAYVASLKLISPKSKSGVEFFLLPFTSRSPTSLTVLLFS